MNGGGKWRTGCCRFFPRAPATVPTLLQHEATHRAAGRGRDGHSYGDRRSRPLRIGSLAKTYFATCSFRSSTRRPRKTSKKPRRRAPCDPTRPEVLMAAIIFGAATCAPNSTFFKSHATRTNRSSDDSRENTAGSHNLALMPTLVASIGLLVFLSVGSILAVNWITGRSIVQNFATRLIARVLSAQEMALRHHLDPAVDQTTFIAKAIRAPRRMRPSMTVSPWMPTSCGFGAVSSAPAAPFWPLDGQAGG